MKRLPPGTISVAEAMHRTGLPRRTLQRRIDAYIKGLTSPYAIRGGRDRGIMQARYVEADDAERVRLQERGELPREIDGEAWLAMGPRARAAAKIDR